MRQIVVQIGGLFLQIHLLHETNVPSKPSRTLNLVVIVAFEIGADQVCFRNALNPSTHKVFFIIDGNVLLCLVDCCRIQRDKGTLVEVASRCIG